MARKKVAMRVSGSSLVEVVIAMVVIVLVFSIALMIVTNVTRSSLNVSKAAAAKVLDKVLAEAESINEADINERTFNAEGLVVKKNIVPYGTSQNLQEITLSALNEKGDTVLTIKKVLLHE
ncbi:hypothetical protein A0256_20880 [Mucilaginibacter sp. PAMC 26640]|nr:hypothetical protein A0256_20880 [Mucilaginibacter sp. PAMC 26640]